MFGILKEFFVAAEDSAEPILHDDEVANLAFEGGRVREGDARHTSGVDVAGGCVMVGAIEGTWCLNQEYPMRYAVGGRCAFGVSVGGSLVAWVGNRERFCTR